MANALIDIAESAKNRQSSKIRKNKKFAYFLLSSAIPVTFRSNKNMALMCNSILHQFLRSTKLVPKKNFQRKFHGPVPKYRLYCIVYDVKGVRSDRFFSNRFKLFYVCPPQVPHCDVL